MTTRRAALTPRARRELAEAAAWIAADNPGAARALRAAVAGALERLGRFPELGAARPDLAPSPVRFLAVRGFPYVMAYDASASPPRVLRVVHGARDLPEVLRGLDG